MKRLRRDSVKAANLLRVQSAASGRIAARVSCPVDLSLLGSLRDISVFAPESELWRALAGRWRSSLKSEQADDLGEDVFCEFNFYDSDAVNLQKRHFAFWTRTLRAFMQTKGVIHTRLVASVTTRPGIALDHEWNSPKNAVLGLLAKYNWQFRRPYPHRGNVELDTWQKAPAKVLDAGQIELFSGREFRVATKEFRETSIWFQEDIDWPALTMPSSMIVPTTDRSAPPWAAGHPPTFYYIRQVSTISFPALCWLFRNDATAAAIEAAWLQMPIVKPGKANRGNKAGKRKLDLRQTK